MGTLLRFVLFLVFLAQYASVGFAPSEGIRKNAFPVFPDFSFATFDQQQAPEHEAEILPYIGVHTYARISFNPLQTDLLAGSFQKIITSTKSRIRHACQIFPPWLKYQSYILFPFHEFI